MSEQPLTGGEEILRRTGWIAEVDAVPEGHYLSTHKLHPGGTRRDLLSTITRKFPEQIVEPLLSRLPDDGGAPRPSLNVDPQRHRMTNPIAIVEEPVLNRFVHSPNALT